jgi:hypothetical protein
MSNFKKRVLSFACLPAGRDFSAEGGSASGGKIV